MILNSNLSAFLFTPCHPPPDTDEIHWWLQWDLESFLQPCNKKEMIANHPMAVETFHLKMASEVWVESSSLLWVSQCGAKGPSKGFVFAISFFFIALCCFGGKHILWKHNQKALETDYQSVTFKMENSHSCRVYLCDCPKSMNVFGEAFFFFFLNHSK